jgi:hypothetical protein
VDASTFYVAPVLIACVIAWEVSVDGGMRGKKILGSFQGPSTVS